MFNFFRPHVVDSLKGYTRQRFYQDVGAGITVGVVALPLAMAFAIASGLKPEAGFAGCAVERKLLNTIISCRVRETLELIKRELEAEKALRYLGGGVLLTGGCSLLEGIDELAGEVFGVPVRLTHAHAVSGPASAFENPQLSAAIGLIKYAQATQPESSKKQIGKFFGRLFGR